MKTWYIIPARKSSKGLPYKNRRLFDYTSAIIPTNIKHQVILTSDDEVLLAKAQNLGFDVINRLPELATDEASVKDVLINVVKTRGLPPQDRIVVLYLTYPERTWKDVQKIIHFLEEHKADSLGCAEEIDTHPYLCMHEANNFKGVPVVEHELYRRQDYPACFQTSLYLGVFKISALPYLGDRLFNEDTIFYKVSKKVDIDNNIDYNTFKYGK